VFSVFSVVNLAFHREPMTDTERDALIARYRPLVHKIANRYADLATPALDRDDLVQEGLIGLIRAVDRYDPARGVRFITLAHIAVQREILRALADRAPAIRIPAPLLPRLGRMIAARQAAEAEGRVADLEELAAAAGLPPARALAILQAAEPPLSLDTPPLDEESRPLIEQLAAPNPADAAAIRALVAALPPDLAAVLRLRYWQELSLAEAGQALGLSRECVRLREQRALTLLREMTDAEAGAL
jgi:RNA polymerase sigma factor (sigma-70 family)